MGKRIALAALVGGILVFMWGAISHMVLGITDSAFEPVPDEAAFMRQLKAAAPPGFYGFPYHGTGEMTDAETAAFEARLKEGPSGILIRWPDGLEMMDGKQLGTEFLSNVAAAFILALVLNAMGPHRSAVTKVFFGALLGAFAFLSQNASYWIWYHFSTEFTKGEAIDAVVSWALAGVACAIFIRAPKPAA